MQTLKNIVLNKLGEWYKYENEYFYSLDVYKLSLNQLDGIVMSGLHYITKHRAYLIKKKHKLDFKFFSYMAYYINQLPIVVLQLLLSIEEDKVYELCYFRPKELNLKLNHEERINLFLDKIFRFAKPKPFYHKNKELPPFTIEKKKEQTQPKERQKLNVPGVETVLDFYIYRKYKYVFVKELEGYIPKETKEAVDLFHKTFKPLYNKSKINFCETCDLLYYANIVTNEFIDYKEAMEKYKQNHKTKSILSVITE